MSPPGRWHTREDSGLRLDRQLTWWHDGERIEHPNIVEAFNRGVGIAEDGRPTLTFGGDWCFIEVEGCAWAVLAVDEGPDEAPWGRLSDRTAEPLDLGTLAVDEDGALTVAVKQGRGRARFSRPAHVALAERLVVTPHGVVMRMGSREWPTSLPAGALTSPSPLEP